MKGGMGVSRLHCQSKFTLLRIWQLGSFLGAGDAITGVYQAADISEPWTRHLEDPGPGIREMNRRRGTSASLSLEMKL